MKKILAIDDQQDNLTTIKAVMKNYMPNCKVLTALSGAEGIKITREEQPDTILLDIIMPGMDGFEVCKKLKAGDSTKHIPVIMITAIKTDSESRVKGLTLGADAFLSKPIDPVELSAQVNVMLRIKEAEDKLRAEKEDLEELVKKRIVDLRESEKKFRNLFENHSAIKLLIDPENGKIVDANKAASLFYGWSIEEIKSMNIFEINILTPGEIKKKMQSALIGEKKNFEFKHRRADGSIRDVRVLSGTVSIGGKEYLHSIIQDITENKKAEKALQENEQKLRLVIDNSPVGICITDLKGHFLDVNPAMCNMVGYSLNEMTGNHFNQFSHPDDIAKNNYLFEKLLEGNIPHFDLEKRYINKNGDIIHVFLRAQLVRDKKGKPLFEMAIVEDITERKLDEELLKKQEARIQSIFRSAPIGIGVVSNRIISQVNNYFCKIIGYTADELINQNAIIFYPTQQEYEKVGLVKYDQIKKYGTGTVETQFKRKDGKIIDILLSSTPINQNDLSEGVTFTALDITERKLAEKKLRESEHKFRLLADHTYDWEYWINPEGKYIYLSQSCRRITGYSPEEFHNNPELLFDLVRPNCAEMVNRHYRNEINKPEPTTNFEFSLINRSGEVRWIEHNCTPVFDDQGNFLGRRGNNRDITERKKAEEDIRKLSTAVHQSPSVIVITGLSGTIEYANPKCSEITGYSNAELVGQNPRILKSGEQPDAFYKELWETISAGNEWRGEFHNKKKNGEFFWESASVSPILDSEGKITNYLKVAKDITEHKKVEDALKQSEEKFRTAFLTSPDSININRLEDGMYVSVNNGFTKIMGYSEEEVIGKTSLEINIWENLDDRKKLIDGLNTKGLVENLEAKFHSKSGVLKDGLISASIISLDGAPHILSITRDNTERKLSEDALRSSEEQNKAITQTAADAIISINAEGVILSWNKAAESIFGYSSAEKINTELSEIIPSQYKAGHAAAMERLINTGNEKLIGKTVQLTAIRKDGVEIPIEFSLSSWEANKQKNYTGIIRDITERKQAEQIQKVLYNISQAAVTSKNTEGLIIIIQKQLGTIIDTKNFYIAFYDEKTDMFFSPFVSDEKDGTTKWPAGKSYSGYVVKTGKSLLVTKEVAEKMRASGKIVNVGLPSKVWLGVPLINEGVANGVLAVQDYSDENAFSAKDVEILEFVASQISTSLERKNAEQTLKESEERFKTLSTLTFEGIVIHDNGIIVDINLSAAKMFGYDYKKIVGKNLARFLNREDFQNKVVKNIKKSYSLPYEIEGIKKDGTRFPIEIEGRDVYIKAENKVLRVAAVRDITERKKAEQIQKVLYNISNAVIATENLEELIGRVQIELGKIIDTTNFHIAFYDEKTDSISVPFFSNKEVDMPEVVKGKTLTRYLIKQKRSLLINKEKLIELRKSNEIRGFEADPEIWLGVPLKNEGMLTGVLAVQSYTDKNAYNEPDLRMLEFVSEQVSISIHRKKAELDLVEALRKATESDRLKSAFLATMSHELRTPLNAIIGFSDFLNKDLPVDEVENFGKIINSSGQHLLSIINDLFDITLIEAGETKVRNKETRLKDVLYGVHTVIEAKKQRDNKEAVELKLIFSEEKEDFSFIADANKIKQILINLLKNAIKFTNNGHIYYGCELLAEQHNSFLKFYVKDTGIGISKDKQNLIFDIFRQADDTHTRKYGGTGIGLSVAKRLAEILGGKIWLESEVGVGSTFYFTIPVEKPEGVSLPSLEGEVAETIADSKTIIILIVEDDLMSFKFIEVVLNKLEIKFIWAQNGEEAIRMCKENKDIDLVLMDINMPLLNGYAATKAIKQMRPGLPIIAQTAFAIAGDREKSLEAGCDDYIAKPIKKDELIAMIRKYLNR